MDDATDCPCGSGLEFGGCCGRFLAGTAAPTAEELMRSRFTAYALRRPDHLLATWHPSTRPAALELEPELVWRRLQIVDTIAGGVDDSDGVVEFRASYRTPDGGGLLHERSRFVRGDGFWLYVDGDVE